MWNVAFELKAVSVKHDIEITKVYADLDISCWGDMETLYVNSLYELQESICDVSIKWNKDVSEVYRELEHIIVSDEVNDCV